MSDTDTDSSSLTSSSSLSSLSSDEIEVLQQLGNTERIIEIEEAEIHDNDVDILPFINLLFQLDESNEDTSTSTSDEFNSIIGSSLWLSSNSSPNPPATPAETSAQSTSHEEDLEDGECSPSPQASVCSGPFAEVHFPSTSQQGNIEYPPDQRVSNNGSGSSTREEIPPRQETPENGKCLENPLNSAETNEPSTSRQQIPEHNPGDNNSDPDLAVLSLTCSSLSSLSGANIDSDKD